MAGERIVTAYEAGELRRGATDQAAAADAADGLARMLAGAALDPAALGTTPSAAAFARAIGTARRSQSGGAAGESRRRATIARRAGATADMGDGLTADTSQLAQSARPAGPPR